MPDGEQKERSDKEKRSKHKHRKHKKNKHGDHKHGRDHKHRRDKEKSHLPAYNVDQRGYINFSSGLLVNGQYRIDEQIGKGTFSRVMKCRDLEVQGKSNGKFVAMKINRNMPKYKAAAEVEMRILNEIREKDKKKESFCIHLKSAFVYNGHRCFVFPLLGKSVYGFLYANKYIPFIKLHVKLFAYQICKAVEFLHENRIIFTDLKPENIVFANERYTMRTVGGLTPHLPYASRYWKARMKEAGYGDSEVMRCPAAIPMSPRLKLIDFGSAVFKGERSQRHLCQTRHYRAPEVVLKMQWGEPIDIWSIGCIILELLCGRMVYNTHDSIDHLNQMCTMIGAMPTSLERRIHPDSWPLFFKPKKEIGSVLEEAPSVKRWKSIINLKDAKISSQQCHPIAEYFGKDEGQILDLVDSMLRWDPKNRVTASAALEHEYFQSIDGPLMPDMQSGDELRPSPITSDTSDKD